MLAFIAWYVIITLLGWFTFPAIYRLFPALADRGYTLARAAGLLIWAYAFWLFTSLGLSSNNVGGILFGLLPVLALSVYALFFARGGDQHGPGGYRSELGQWLRSNLRLVITAEVLFLVAFVLLALLRAGNPTLDNAEKPMELMFINSILRSPAFPPHDGWLSGYAISYYYFGYVMTAMLAQISGVTGSMAHNLMTALVFALAAVGSYGILFNLLASITSQGRRTAEITSATRSALLAPLFALIVSNVEGFLEVLHRAGVFWTGTRNFWTWLDIKELNQPPASPLGLLPDRFWWWWRASRVISDYDLLGEPREVIDEFPFFSFLHADLHPHVLAIPFVFLAIAVALNIFLGGWKGRTNVFGLNLKISAIGFLASALVLGGLAFVNVWDILLGAALLVLAYGLFCVRTEGWSWECLLDMLAFGVLLVPAALILFLPFYLGFSSQAGGLLPNLVTPTRGAQLWVMFAPLFIPLLGYLPYLGLGERRRGRWSLAILLTLGLILGLVAALIAAAAIIARRDPAAASSFLQAQGLADYALLVGPALTRRLLFIGGLLSMLAILVPALAYLTAMPTGASGNPSSRVKKSPGPKGAKAAPRAPELEALDGGATYFSLLLMVLGALLVIGPEFVYLRDQFGYRLNTIFKFYFQAWLLWSIPAAMAVAILLRRLRGAIAGLYAVVLALVLLMSLTYPVLAVDNKTNGFKPYFGWTLEDFRRLESGRPDEAAGLLWLRAAPFGVVAEAVGGSYSDYGRVSVYTGLPSVLGWPGHEVQWRGTADPQGSRQSDIKLLYEAPDWETAGPIIAKYEIRYVFIGTLERTTYAVEEAKFAANLNLAFQRGEISIYEAP